MDLVINTLQKFGLSKKEASLYLRLFESGTQSASVMSKKMGIPRSTAQFLLNSLTMKSFTTKSIKNGITYYHAESPNTLKKVLDIKANKYYEEIEKQKEELEIVTPLIKQTNPTQSHIPKVTFYEGIDNVIKSFFDFIEKTPKDSIILNYVSPAKDEEITKKFRKAMEKFIKVRSEKNIASRTICTYCEDAVRLQLTDKTFNRKTLIRSKTDNYFSEILISENAILDTSYYQGEIFASLTQNKSLVQMRSSIFNMAWNEAKKENSEILKQHQTKVWIEKNKDIMEY